MKKWFIIITLILIFPANVLAANLTTISPQDFISAYKSQVRMAFKGLDAPYQRYKQNFIIHDVVYVSTRNTYVAIVDNTNIMNLMWIDVGENNGIKTITVTISDNHPDLLNVLFHYMDLITNTIGMYGVIDMNELINVIKRYQDSYIFSYRGDRYIITSYKNTFSNMNFTAINLSAY